MCKLVSVNDDQLSKKPDDVLFKYKICGRPGINTYLKYLLQSNEP